MEEKKKEKTNRKDYWLHKVINFNNFLLEYKQMKKYKHMINLTIKGHNSKNHNKQTRRQVP
jgi:hypothetical protein